MVTVNLITSGAQKTYLVAVKSQETDSNYSASVRTQHSGRARTALITGMMELSGLMESGAAANNSIVTIRLTEIIIMEKGPPLVLMVFWLSVKTRVIRYMSNSHSAT